MANANWEDGLGRVLERWVDFVRLHALAVILLCAVGTVAAGAYAARFLTLNFDHTTLLSPQLPFRVRYREFAKTFPILDEALLVVVDGGTPEAVRRATDQLATRLRSDTESFRDVFVPGSGEFFDRHALLYLSVDELEEFADQVARIQPIFAELVRDGSMANLSSLLERGLREQRDADWPAVLDRISAATLSLYQEIPVAVSWESLLLDGTSLDPTTRRVIIAQPILDYRAFLPAGAAIDAARRAAAEVNSDGAVRIRLTGNPALNQEEMLGLAWDIGVSGGFCFLLVAGVLFLALRNLRLVIAAIVTLLAGLVWTAAFAAAAVGSLNLLSICFAVLFIGLGVDFGIHVGMHYADAVRRGADHAAALRETAALVGSSLVLCTLTTTIGFYVFVPTPYRGVGELGLIAGTGMIICLFLTVTLLPALLTRGLAVDPRHLGSELRFRADLGGRWLARPRLVATVAVALGAAALFLVPRSRFDANVVEMRDPDTESVEAFQDLLGDATMSPWYIDLVVPNVAAADALAARLRRLPEVGRVLTVSQFVPDRQEEKLEILEDLSVLMELPSAPRRDTARGDSAKQMAALRGLHDFLGKLGTGDGSALAASMRRLRDVLGRFLQRAESVDDPAPLLAELEKLLLGGLPAQFARLRLALHSGPVTLADLPPELRSRMLAPDGRARVQAFSANDLSDSEGLYRFADAIKSVDPDITGLIANILAFGRATVQSLRQALGSAAVVMALLLWSLWRRWRDVALVLGILTLGALYTGAAMVLLGMPYNFSNVVVLPLLLGVGIDSAIHLVHRWRGGGLGDDALLSTTTARAVFYSALTTVTSFGTLALSAHRGVASLGVLLVLGMAMMLFCNLIVLPAFLAVSQRAHS